MKKILAILCAAAATFSAEAAETSYVNYSTAVTPPAFDLIWSYDTTTANGVTSAIITGVKTSAGKHPTGDLAVPYSVSETAAGPAYVVKGIADGTFANQIGLTTISIPVAVESIGTGVFSGCTVLSSISVDEGNPWFTSFNGALYNKDHTKLIACPARTEIIVLPATLVEIGPEAFANCHRLSSLSVPASVTSIGNRAFLGCSRLASVEFDGNAPNADGSIIQGANAALTFYRPTASTGWDAPPWNGFNVQNTAGEQPSGVVSASARNVTWQYRVINGEAEIYNNGTDAAIPASTSQTFHFDDEKLVWVGDGRLVIPSSLGGYPVTRIGVSAFRGCSALTEIEIPNTIRVIGDFAFANCTGVSSLTIPSGVRKIGRHPFSGASITSLALPDSLRELDGNPIAGCDTVLTISISTDNSYFTVLNGILYDKDVLTLIGCPARKESASIAPTVMRIGPEAFDGCFRLRAILLPESLTSIGKNAFGGAIRLASLTFPASVTDLEDPGLFTGCASLEFISFSGNAPNVDAHIFDGASADLLVYATQGTTGWKDATTALPASGKWPSDDEYGRAIANLDVPAEEELKEGDTFTSVVADGTVSYAYTLKILADRGVEIIGISPKPNGNFVVPSIFESSIGALTVKSLGDGLFANAIGLLSTTVPNSVTNMGNEVFKDCNVLSSVTLAHGLRSIGRHPFAGTAIETIALPDTVRTIDGNILYGCNPSVSLSIGNNSPYFAVSPEGALYDKDFKNLLSVPMNTEALTVPETTTNIAEEAFAGCIRIKSLVFCGDAPAATDGILADTPESLTISVPANSHGWDGDPSSSALPADRLWCARSISSEEVSDVCTDGTWYWIVQDGTALLYNNGKSALVNTATSGAIAVPEKVTDSASDKEYTVAGLGSRALFGCKFVTSISLPETIETIDEDAFYGTHISTLDIPKFVKSISGNPAAGCEYLTGFSVNSENLYYSSDGSGLLYDHSKKQLLSVPPRATSITVPETVTEIQIGAFSGCAALADVTYAGTAPTAPDGIYADTPAELTSWANDGAGFPSGSWKGRAIVIKTVDANLLTVPVEVYVDGTPFTFNWRYAFDLATGTAKLITVEPKPIDEIEIPGVLVASVEGTTYSFAVTEICDGAFRDAPALTKVKTSASLLKIGDYAFSNCTALAEVELSYGLRSIGKRPFVNTAIPELTLPDTLLEMDGNIAAGAIYDMKLNISDSSHFTFSDDGVLYNKDMTKLYACPTRAEGTITIPSTVTNICQDAFFGCFRLSYLNIPENVNTIGEGTFNVNGIWPGLSAPEATPKLQSIFYNGPLPNAADDIYEHAPADLVSYAFATNWPSTWKGRPVTVISSEDEADTPILAYKDSNGITWYYRIIKGEAEIYNNNETAISPKSTPGVPFHFNNDNTQYWSNLWVLNVPAAINGYVVTRIGAHAFDGCNNLTRIGIPSSVKSIGDYAFRDCTAIKTIAADRSDSTAPLYYNDGELELPTGIKSLGYHPFEGLKSISISIPYTVNETVGNPLAGMEFVTTVEVDAANPKFYSSGNIIYNKGRTAVIGVPSNYDGSSISFLDSVTTIGNEALHGCANLGTITLPPALETISTNAFAGCSGLSAITIPETVTKIDSAAFSNCTALAKVTYAGNAPTAAEDIYVGTSESMASWINEGATGFTEGTWKARPLIAISFDNPQDEELSYDNGVATWYFRIVDGMAEIWRKGDRTAVASDEPILNLSLPQTLGGYIVKGIGNGALADLRGITSINIPNTYEWIGDYAFSNCTSLASVSLGNGVEKIGKWPFYGTKLTTLSIPDSVSEIEGNPVAGCAMMTAVSVAESQPYLAVDADGLLYDKKQETLFACPATKSAISLPDTLITINDDAFYGCNLLDSTSTTIDGVTWTFEINDGKATITEVSGASGDVTIPEFLGVYPVEEIKDGAFVGCTNITSFASDSAAFSTRKGILYSADGTALICVPDTLTLPYVVTTSNISMTVITYVEAGASGGLPYVKRTETTNAPVTQVSTESMPGDISFEDLLAGVTEIRGYAFNGVNAFEPSITTNGLSSGKAIPDDGKAYAYLTNSLTIVSITHSSQIPVAAKTMTIAADAFASSGLIYNPDKATPTTVLRTISTENEPLPGTSSTYFGCLYNSDDAPCGTIQVKIAKARNGIAKATTYIQVAGAKKKTLKGSLDISSGNITGIDLSVSRNSLSGSYNGFTIEGARDLFSSKQKEDKAEAAKALGSCPKVINIAWPGGTLAVKISSNGKSKVTGTLATGANISATSQLIIGGDWLCVPVWLSKSSTFFLVWISRTDGTIEVEGLANAVAGAVANLRGDSTFLVDADHLANLVALSASKRKPESVNVSKDAIPDGITISQSGSTWTAPKHESALKLRYTESTRSFKGTFKTFFQMNGRQKSTTVTVSGVLIGDVGYGFAIVKKAGATPITIR